MIFLGKDIIIVHNNMTYICVVGAGARVQAHTMRTESANAPHPAPQVPGQVQVVRCA